ncbi:ABC transporter [Serratia marcescens]|uniref:ABC transporter n=1 Tax=Serratia marcescens TaxID=615 RepID=A0A1Q4NXQ6_SERMA|nr:ABC transporter ATP-binding protein [Serratia marcescens]OKB65668.1 ABC transporter [Serratia marcescens]
MNPTSPDRSSSLPPVARRRLFTVGLAWVGVAAIEAATYTLLALTIIRHASPEWVFVAAAVAVLATILTTRAGFLSGTRLAGDLYALLGDALARAKLSWFTHEHRARVALMAGRGIPGFMSIPAHQLQTFLHAPLMPLFLLFGMGMLAGTGTALMAGALLILALLAQYLAQRALARADKQRHTADENATQATLELVDHLELLRTAAGPKRAVERLEQRWQAQESALAATNRAAAGAVLAAFLASVLPLAGMAAFAALAGLHDPALILALLVMTGRAAAPLGELALAGIGLNDLRAAVQDYRQITAAPALAEPTTNAAQSPHGHHLSVKHISHAPVLDSISLEIPPGSKVWVAGASGSGKSTLLALLMRFDDPQQGHISLGGTPLTQMHYADLATHIAYVSQEPIVFSGSLAENVRLGNPLASEQDVERAMRQAALGPLIERSPLGIHQSVGHQGSALSGGERQRVALARALLKQAPILILDEATSALDEKTEREVAHVVRALPVTVIMVTHRDAALWQPTHTLFLPGSPTAANAT